MIISHLPGAIAAHLPLPLLWSVHPYLVTQTRHCDWRVCGFSSGNMGSAAVPAGAGWRPALPALERVGPLELDDGKAGDELEMAGIRCGHRKAEV